MRIVRSSSGAYAVFSVVSWGASLAGLLCSASFLAPVLNGQTPVLSPEGPGVLVAGDFDADGYDDVFLIGYRGESRNYHGRRSAPHFVAGGKWIYGAQNDLADCPIYLAGHLFVPVASGQPGSGTIDVYRYENGNWKYIGQKDLPCKNATATVRSIKICPLERDIDGDKLPDVFVAWSESELTSTGAFHTAEFGIKGLKNQVDIPFTKYMHKETRIADVHRSRSIANKATEFLVVLSAPYNSWGGFGFVTVDSGSKVTANLWAVGAPPLESGGWAPSRSVVAYGQFSIMPKVYSPMLKLHTGESLVFQAWFQPPYVRSSFELLESNRQHYLFDSATYDYDGDGYAEIVLGQSKNRWAPSHVFVGDPSKKRAYAQGMNLQTGGPGTPPLHHHGCHGDFNGDGLHDLALSFSLDSSGKEVGYLGLLLATVGTTGRQADRGRPVLQRVH